MEEKIKYILNALRKNHSVAYERDFGSGQGKFRFDNPKGTRIKLVKTEQNSINDIPSKDKMDELIKKIENAADEELIANI